MKINRCKWAANITDEEYLAYHDEEWSVPITDNQSLFELICLEGAQAGLSWQTILKKRKGYRASFEKFDINKLVKFDQKRLDKILLDGGVVKHAGKIKSVVANAKATIELLKEFKSLHAYFVTKLEGVDTHDPAVTQQPVSPASIAISKDMKKRGFNFVGPTTIQAFLQASGLYHSHDDQCFRFKKPVKK